MIKVPVEIDPYSDVNIKRISNQNYAKEIFKKVFNFLELHHGETGYENEIKRMRDLKNSLDYAWEKGCNEGRKEGLRIAKKMKDYNFSIDDIAKYTNYSKEEIENLK
jgi:predicted transposase/invertase (TIGR01784 family)